MEYVIGSKTNPIATDSLASDLQNLNMEGTLYTAYPILASPEGDMIIDALFVSEDCGILIFDFPTTDPSQDAFLNDIEEKQNNLYFVIKQKLSESKELRKGRELVIEPVVISYLPIEVNLPIRYEGIIIVGTNTIQNLPEIFTPIQPEYFRALNATLQRVATLRPEKKRSSVQKTDSRGALLKKIEKEIANLDRWQNHAAIETPESPQCIRGLAGSGKTIVLALKAAYLHARNPVWNIAITFHTRSLYQQFKNLVRNFYYPQKMDEPDWSKLKILHSWGTKSEPGIYSEIAYAYGIMPKTYSEAKNQYGQSFAFGGICEELIKNAQAQARHPLYDIVLIDEAQDLPKEFFQMVYEFAVGDTKRIVLAYDELQNLGDFSMPPADELFGSDPNGNPIVNFRNQSGQPRQDVVLPICYRNTPWALATAHALGFGIYRKDSLVQYFNESSEHIWNQIGYEVISGSLEPDKFVSLGRRKDSAPEYFYKLLEPEDAVQCHVFSNAEQQAEWLATNIQINLEQDELEPSDILVILPNPLNVPEDASLIVNKLAARGIQSHIAGITSSRDLLFIEKSIAITGIYRAKGNEAPMVYVLNSQYGYEGPELNKRRNVLFTAISRSKGWVRITGYGFAMEMLKKEVDKIIEKKYRLEFRVPTDDELARMRKIYRDVTDEERNKIKQVSEFIALIEKGDLSIENVPPELKEKLRKYFGKR